jgi:hypothetical protein
MIGTSGLFDVLNHTFPITLDLWVNRSNLRLFENTAKQLRKLLRESEITPLRTSPAPTSASGSRKARSRKSGSTTSSSRSVAPSRKR